MRILLGTLKKTWILEWIFTWEFRWGGMVNGICYDVEVIGSGRRHHKDAPTVFERGSSYNLQDYGAQAPLKILEIRSWQSQILAYWAWHRFGHGQLISASLPYVSDLHTSAHSTIFSSFLTHGSIRSPANRCWERSLPSFQPPTMSNVESSNRLVGWWVNWLRGLEKLWKSKRLLENFYPPITDSSTFVNPKNFKSDQLLVMPCSRIFPLQYRHLLGALIPRNCNLESLNCHLRN